VPRDWGGACPCCGFRTPSEREMNCRTQAVAGYSLFPIPCSLFPPGPSPRTRTLVIIRSLFFASYRDFAGQDELAVELPDGARVADLVAGLRARGGELARLPESPVTAVNMEYAPLGTRLRDGDEVAFIPPVAGG
jgi:molybdopterin converting factor subunit 1